MLFLLTPLLDAKRYALKLEKDADINGNPAAVVSVTGTGIKDVKLFFDKKSNRLVKTQRRGFGKGASEQKSNLAAMLHAMETVIASQAPVSGKLIFVCCLSGETGKHDAIRSVIEGGGNLCPDLLDRKGALRDSV